MAWWGWLGVGVVGVIEVVWVVRMVKVIRVVKVVGVVLGWFGGKRKKSHPKKFNEVLKKVDKISKKTWKKI